MSIQFKKVLITGAEGFIGSHVTEELVRNGYSVRATALYNSFADPGWLKTLSPEISKEIETVFCDIRDPFSTDKAVQGCDAVLHLASLIAIPYSYQAPQSYVATNIQGTLNILEACKKNSVSWLVSTSTSEVYGTAQTVPILEDHPLQAQSPYAASKISADQMCLSYYRSFDLPAMVLRPFNTFGPRQSMRAIIPTLIRQCLSSSKDIKIGDTKPTRDLLYVKDTARGFLAALQSPHAAGEVIQLATGSDISIGDLAHKIKNLTDQDHKKLVQEEKRLRPEKSEVFRLCGSATKANQILSWKPKYDLDQGLLETIEWFKNPAHSAFYPDPNQFVV